MTVDPQILEFAKHCPVTDKNAIVEEIYNTLSEDFDPDSFIISVLDIVDYNRISSFQALLMLSDLKAESKNGKAIMESAKNYIVMVVDDPSVFQSDLTFLNLSEHFVQFFLSAQVDYTWFDQIVDIVKGIDESNGTDEKMKLFVDMIRSLAQKSSQKDVSGCIPFIQIIDGILGNKIVRKEFVESPQMYSIMKEIMSQSVFPTDSEQRCSDYFGKDPKNVSQSSIGYLDTLMNDYHNALISIFSKLLSAIGRQQTIKLIKRFVGECSNISRDGFIMNSKDSTKKLEAFGFHLEHVIIALALKFKNKLNTITTASVYHPSSVVTITRETPLLAMKGKNSTWVDPRRNPKESEPSETEWVRIIEESPEPTCAPQLFFAGALLLEYVSASFIRITKNIARHIRYLRDKKEESTNPLEKEQIELVIQRMIMNIVVIRAHLLFEERMRDLNDFFIMALDFLKMTANYDEETFLLPEHPPIDYMHVPEFVLSSTTSLFHFLLDNNRIRSPEFVLPRLAAIFSNPEFIRSHVVKNSIVQIFALIANDRNNSHLVTTIPHILEHMFPPVVQFFSDVQITTTQHEFYDKFEYRDGCQDLLKKWFNYPEYKQFFIDHCNEEVYEKLVTNLINDNLDFVGKAFPLFEALFEQTESENIDEQTEVTDNRQQLHYWMRSINKAFELIYCIAGFCPQVFDKENNAEIFSTLVSSSLYQCVMRSETLDIKNPEEIEWKKYRFFIIVASCVSRCTSEISVHNFVSCERYYSDELIDKTVDMLWDVQAPRSVIDDFNYFGELAKKEAEAMREEEIDDSDAPEELLDPILYTLMTNPVRLPDGQVLDMSSYLQILQNTRKSPLTQEPIKEGDGVPALDIKAKVDEYIARKRAEMRASKK